MSKNKHVRIMPWPRHALVAFVDVDYSRASRYHGPRFVRTNGPETWRVERIGIVWGNTARGTLTLTDREIIAGRRPVFDAIERLADADLIVGHGFLSGDLRSFAMVSEIPRWLVERCVDILVVLHKMRGRRYPTGLNLSDLSRLNLAQNRPKPHHWSPAVTGMRWENLALPAGRGPHDPQEDAEYIALLWTTLLETRRVRWGAGQPGYSCKEGDVTWPGSPEATALLARSCIDELTGRKPMSIVQWTKRVQSAGQVLENAPASYDASQLAKIGHASIFCDVSTLEICAHILLSHYPILNVPESEELLTAFQLLGSQANMTARQALVKGRFFRSAHRVGAYLWALWRVMNPTKHKEWEHARRWRNATATGVLEYSSIQREQDAILAHCYQLADQLKSSSGAKTP